MEMTYKDYEFLMDYCCFILNPKDDTIYFKYKKHPNKKRQIVNSIIKKFNEISKSEFTEKHKQYFTKYKKNTELKEKLRVKKVSKFKSMSSNEVVGLSFKEKVDYLEALFPDSLLREDFSNIKDLIVEQKDNLKACLFNMKFSREFMDKESKLVDQFWSKIKHNENTKNMIADYDNCSLEDRKNLIRETLEIFYEVYGVESKDVNFYNSESYLKRREEKGWSVDVHVPGAFYNGSFNFNEERLMKSDNFFPISVPFHEAIHLYQTSNKFEDEDINRVMTANIGAVKVYEDEEISKDDVDYKDFYTMLPFERHAFGVQYELEDKIRDDWKIEKSENHFGEEDKHILNTWEKARIMTVYDRSDNGGEIKFLSSRFYYKKLSKIKNHP